MLFPILTAFLLVGAGAGLDREAVRKLQAEGNLDRAIAILEGHLRAGAPFPREDSLFLYKHLGALHTRKENREAGRECFRKLLRMDPGARITDVDSSPAVQVIFREAGEDVADEGAVSEPRRVVARFETVPPAVGRRPSNWSGTGRTWVWVGAAGLGVAGAALGYHYLVDGERPEDKVISLTD